MSNKKERGIMFSPEMIQAILDGRKTQTRRVVNMNSGICKYGMVGDLLYVKEAWEHSTHPLHKFMYKAHAERHSGLVMKWKSPRFMPKSAARIWLEITEIRVERLHDITSNDIKAEGVSYTVDYYCDLFEQWQNLWIKIKGQQSWDANPWVWVISFKRIDKSDTQ